MEKIFSWFCQNSSYCLEIGKILIPAIISILLIFIARSVEIQKEAENKIRENKILIYENFILHSMNFVLKYGDANEKQKNKMLSDMTKVFDDFNKHLLFWGSDKIIREYINYKTSLGADDDYAAMKNYEKFAFALRKDIGHKNKKLKQFDLIKLFLKPEELDKNGNIKKVKIDKN